MGYGELARYRYGAKAHPGNDVSEGENEDMYHVGIAKE
jgi:hypothetical protein